jgi:hypothetical protein
MKFHRLVTISTTQFVKFQPLETTLVVIALKLAFLSTANRLPEFIAAKYNSILKSDFFFLLNTTIWIFFHCGCLRNSLIPEISMLAELFYAQIARENLGEYHMDHMCIVMLFSPGSGAMRDLFTTF